MSRSVYASAPYREVVKLRKLAAHASLDAVDADEANMPITAMVSRQLAAYYLHRCREIEADHPEVAAVTCTPAGTFPGWAI